MTPRGDARTHRFTMVMTPEEREQLDAVAESTGRTAADWIRWSVREAFEALPKKKPKR